LCTVGEKRCASAPKEKVCQKKVPKGPPKKEGGRPERRVAKRPFPASQCWICEPGERYQMFVESFERTEYGRSERDIRGENAAGKNRAQKKSRKKSGGESQPRLFQTTASKKIKASGTQGGSHTQKTKKIIESQRRSAMFIRIVIAKKRRARMRQKEERLFKRQA